MSLGAAGLQPGPITATLALRAATADDYESLFACHTAAFRSHIEQLWGWDEAWQRRDFARLFEAVPPLIVVARGLSCGYLQTMLRADAIHLVNIALLADAREQGIGSQLIARLKQVARNQGADITLAVFRTNARAAAFYTRLGFIAERASDTHDYRRWRQQANRP